jgi:transposase InsO family protein
MAVPLPLQFFLLLLAGWVNRHQETVIEYLKEENRVLRELHGKRRLRFTDDQRRRLAVKGKALGRRVLGEVGSLVTPDTILRWYRRLIAVKYDGSKRRRPGRPRTAEEIASLVVRIASENPRFGYTRIRDVLGNLGHEIARNTVKRILRERGLEPAPERSKRVPWKTFLRAHWGAIAAADFFTVEVMTWFGLVRYHVFFVMDLKTRRVEIAGIAHDAHGRWMVQIARNLTDAVDGFLRDKRFLILDRDPLYTRAFRGLLRGSGVDVVRLPRRSPNLNAHAERFVLSVRTECLNSFIPLGEGHLRWALAEYLAHYHRERNHQGLGGRLIEPSLATGQKRGRVVGRSRLGGLLRHYEREAA